MGKFWAFGSWQQRDISSSLYWGLDRSLTMESVPEPHCARQLRAEAEGRARTERVARLL